MPTGFRSFYHDCIGQIVIVLLDVYKRQVVDVNRQRISQSEAGIELAKALLETAELNLSYTIITAPCNGYTSRKEIQVGQLVQPGQTLLDIIESGDAVSYTHLDVYKRQPIRQTGIEYSVNGLSPVIL